MKEPEHLSYFSVDHANCRFTASNTPGLKNSRYTAPDFVTPQANNALSLPGAAEYNPPKANETDGSSASFNHRKQFGRDGLGVESEGFVGIVTIINHLKETNRKL